MNAICGFFGKVQEKWNQTSWDNLLGDAILYGTIGGVTGCIGGVLSSAVVKTTNIGTNILFGTTSCATGLPALVATHNVIPEENSKLRNIARVTVGYLWGSTAGYGVMKMMGSSISYRTALGLGLSTSVLGTSTIALILIVSVCSKKDK